MKTMKINKPESQSRELHYLIHAGKRLSYQKWAEVVADFMLCMCLPAGSHWIVVHHDDHLHLIVGRSPVDK